MRLKNIRSRDVFKEFCILFLVNINFEFLNTHSDRNDYVLSYFSYFYMQNFSVIIMKDFFNTEHEIKLYIYEIVNINQIGNTKKRADLRTAIAING